MVEQASCALLSGVKPLFLGLQKLIDLGDEFQKFGGVLLDSSQLTQFTPTLSGFANTYCSRLDMTCCRSQICKKLRRESRAKPILACSFSATKSQTNGVIH